MKGLASRVRGSLLLLAVLLLLTTPLTLFVARGFSWVVTAKLVVATLLLAGWLWLRRCPPAGPPRHRPPLGVLCGYALAMCLVAVAGVALTWLAGRCSWQLRTQDHRQGVLSPQTRKLLDQQPGPVRVLIGLAPADRRRVALEQLLDEAAEIHPRLSWRLASAEERALLEKKYSLAAGSGWLLLSGANSTRTALLGDEPEAALANGLAGLLGRRQPVVIRPAPRGAPPLLLTTGQLNLLALLCLDLLPVLLLLLAMTRRRAGQA